MIEVQHKPKLYMVLLGSKAESRNVEQHDFFFGVANSLANFTHVTFALKLMNINK